MLTIPLPNDERGRARREHLAGEDDQRSTVSGLFLLDRDDQRAVNGRGVDGCRNTFPRFSRRGAVDEPVGVVLRERLRDQRPASASCSSRDRSADDLEFALACTSADRDQTTVSGIARTASSRHGNTKRPPDQESPQLKLYSHLLPHHCLLGASSQWIASVEF